MTCPKCQGLMLEIVTHEGLCRGGAGCRCPKRSEYCPACKVSQAPAVRKGNPRIVHLNIDQRRADGWLTPREKRIQAKRQNAGPAPKPRAPKARGRAAIMPTKRDGAVGMLIRKKRVGLGVSQKYLALRAGCSTTYLSESERGLHHPSAELQGKLFAALERIRLETAPVGLAGFGAPA